MKDIIPVENITNKIYIFRGFKVMIDRDLAELYGVETKVLNQAVKRNIERFPEDFMFQLSIEEKNELVTNCDRLNSLKYSAVTPYVFTEHGTIMAASVLNSQQAVIMSVFIVMAFVKMRELVSSHAEILKWLDELEEKIGEHDEALLEIILAIKKLTETRIDPHPKKKQKIGFEQKK